MISNLWTGVSTCETERSPRYIVVPLAGRPQSENSSEDWASHRSYLINVSKNFVLTPVVFWVFTESDQPLLESPWNSLFKKALVPSEEEIQRNRRARSAKLRVAERISIGSELLSDNAFAGTESGRKNRYLGGEVGEKQRRKIEKQLQQQNREQE